MKEKITYLILGILIGAVITAGCFLVFSKTQEPGMMKGERPEGFENMVEGGMRGNRGDGNFVPPDGTEPPAKPDETGNTVTEE